MSWGKGSQASSSTQLEKGGLKNTEDESIIDNLKTKSAGKSRKDVRELLMKDLKISFKVSEYLSDQLVSCIENRESIKNVCEKLQLKYTPPSSDKSIISFFDKKQNQLMSSQVALEKSVDVANKLKELFEKIAVHKYDQAVDLVKKNLKDIKNMQNTIVELKDMDREARNLFQLIFKSKETNFYLLDNAGNKYQKGSSAIALICQQLNNRYIQLRQFRDNFEQIELVNKKLLKGDVTKFQKLLQRYIVFAKAIDKEFADLYFIKESYEKIMTHDNSIQKSVDHKNCVVTLNLNNKDYRKQVENFQAKMEEILDQHKKLKYESILPEKAKATMAKSESGSNKKQKDIVSDMSSVNERINQGKRIKQLQLRIAQLQVQLDSFSSQKQKDQIKIRWESKNKIEQLSKKVTQNQKLIAQKEIQIKQLKQKQFSQLQTKLKEKEQQFQLKLKKQVNEWQNKLRISNKTNEEQKQQLQRLTEAKKETQGSLTRCQEQKKSKLQREIKQLQQILQGKTQQIRLLLSKKKQDQATIQSLRKCVQQADLENKQKQLNINQLETSIQKYTQQIEEFKKLSKQENLTRQGLKKWEQQYQQLKAHLEQSEKRQLRLGSQILKKQDEEKKLSGELVQQSTKLAQRQEEFKKLEEQLSKCRSKISYVERQLEQNKVEQNKLNEQCQKLNQQKATAGDKLKKAQEQHQVTLNNLKDQLRLEREESKRKCDIFEQQIKQLQLSVSSLTEQKSKVEELLHSLEDNCEVMKKQFEQEKLSMIQKLEAAEQLKQHSMQSEGQIHIPSSLAKYLEFYQDIAESENLTQEDRFVLCCMDRYFQGNLLANQIGYKCSIISIIEKFTGKTIVRSTMAYAFDPRNKASFHQYIDGKSNLLCIGKTMKGVYFACYYSGAYVEKKVMAEPALLISLKSGEVFDLLPQQSNSKTVNKGMIYDEYFLIFGNSEIRIKAANKELYSNFAINNAYFNSRGFTVDVMLGEGATRQTVLESFEVYSLSFMEDMRKKEE